MKMIPLRSLFLAPLASWVAGPALAAIPVAPGYRNDFTATPAGAADFSTLSISGTSGSIGDATQLDAAVQALAAADISSALLTSATYVPSANALARHNTNSSGLFLQSRPTGNGAILLMATVTNGCDLDRRRHGHAGRARGCFSAKVLPDRGDGRSLTREDFLQPTKLNWPV